MVSRSWGISFVGGLLALCGGSSAVLAQNTLMADQSVLREGEGTRRTALDKRERTTFPSAAWAALSDWTNGPALSSTSIQDRPVLIVTWTDYLPTARKAVQAATRMSERFGKDGLIVLMVHPEQEWATVVKPKAGEGSMLVVAKDVKGQFRKLLDVDQDPDFYVIDRAGQLRFADVTVESIETACEIVVKEAGKEAAGLNARLKAEEDAASKAARRTSAINNQASFTNIPDLSFRQPSESEYAKAEWPALPLDEQKQTSNPGLTLLARPVTLTEDNWIPKRPNLKGRVVVAYLFHPRLSRFKSFNDLIPRMDLFQRQYGRDVVVVGLLTNFEQVNLAGITFTDDDKDVAKLEEAFKVYAKSRNFEHYLATSFGSNLYLQATDQSGGGEFPIPAFVIISTDGVCRWWSAPKARATADAALLQVLRADPGVQARRKAEQDWLKNNPQAVPDAPSPASTPEDAPVVDPAKTKPPSSTGGG